MTDNDDAQIGRLLNRREALALFGSAGAALLVACTADKAPPAAPSPGASTTQATAPAAATATSAGTATSGAATLPSCVVVPALTEGPYFVDEKLNRTDIRSDPSDNSVREGAPLLLSFNVSRVSGGACSPIADAAVDIWHCDAAGVYSDVSDPSFNTRGKKFLRGYQVTSAGKAQFTTIYPGWYQGRAVHIHFKIRGTASGRTYEFTSQLFFDDALSDQVFTRAPYSSKTGNRLKNSGDGIYRDGGAQLLLNVTPSGAGYAASFDIGLQV